jgi:Bacterial Ig-like domain (group 3)/FG-GAP-like repeat
MTRHFVRKIRIIGFTVLLTIASTALSTQSSQAQTTDSRRSGTPKQLGTLGPSRIRLSGQQRLDAHPTDTGNPLLQPAVPYNSGGSLTYAMATADLNGDGISDVVTANFDGTVGVLLGNGNGTFKNVVSYSGVGNNAVSILIADVNGDHKPDVIVGNMSCSGIAQTCVTVMLGNGDGTFKPATGYGSGGNIEIWGGLIYLSMAVGDLNHDGKPDIVVANQCFSSTNCANGSVGVLLGNGDGTFQPLETYSSGAFLAGDVVIADLNNDGRPDLIVTNCAKLGSADCSGHQQIGNGQVAVLVGNGDGTFQAAKTYSSGATQGAWSQVVVADVNKDGIPDLLVANEGGKSGNGEGSVGVLLGKGNGTFAAVAKYDSGSTYADFIAVGDLNGDGHADLAVSNASGTMGILLGNGDGTFRPVQTYSASVTGGSQTAEFVDVNGDGNLDVAITNSASVAVLVGNGDGTLQAAQSFSSGGFLISGSAFADADGNGSPDLLVANMCANQNTCLAGQDETGSVAVLLNSNGSATSTTTALTSSKNPSVYQTPVTFTAVVSASSGTPTGTVAFFDGKSSLGSETLVSGTASLTTSSLVRGPHSITASYLGAGNFTPSVSAVLSQTVNLTGLFNTQTSLNHPGPSYVGQPVTFIATVASNGGPIPDGDTVTFSDESAGNIGSGMTHGGVASFTTSSLSPRSHIIGAFYNGDPDFNTSFTQITQVVSKYPTTTVLTASPNPASYGQSVTFIATVTSSGPTPTGTVRFTGIGSATLVGGVAMFTKPLLRAGKYSVTAEYVGDANSATSNSAALQEVVNPASTTTTLTSSANPSSSGQSVKFTATVTSSTGVNPSGKVTFTAGATTLGSVALKNNVASISTAKLPTGSTTITATYGGATEFTGSVDSLTQTVNP